MARYARVSAIMYGGSSGQDNPLEVNVREARALIDRAALDQPDLVVLPECFNALGLGMEETVAAAEPSDGPTVTAIAEKARQYGIYIVCPIFERVNGTVYNSAILLDRQGNTAATYHKMWPTICEIDLGVTPGHEAVVAETDFGKLGFAICFDLNFRPVGEGNRDKGAKLVAFSSMYRGGISARIWAYDFGFFLVSSTPSEMSHFCTPVGRVLGDLWHYQPVMTREINLDFEILHIDTNERRWDDIRRKYGRYIDLDIYGPEGIFMMTSRHPEVTVEDVMMEFGLESRKDYFERATRRREEALAERDAIPEFGF